MNPDPIKMPEMTETAPAPKKPRRRLTPEQRIAEKEAEIQRIKEQQRVRVYGNVEALIAALREASDRATEAGMMDTAERIDAAIKALTGK
jgi:predicted DNA-binding protein (UPF0278 family)